jgi:hypothetical protein
VGFDVSCQSALHSKGPKTLRTLEGFLVRVDADVTHKVTGLPELLGAVRTHVPPHPVLLTDGAWSDKERTVQPSLETAAQGPAGSFRGQRQHEAMHSLPQETWSATERWNPRSLKVSKDCLILNKALQAP